jgi:hypothetical protein
MRERQFTPENNSSAGVELFKKQVKELPVCVSNES